MHKYLLCAGLLLATPLAQAQAQVVSDPAATPGRFCVVRSSGLLDDSRPNFTADYGRAAKKAHQLDVESAGEAFRQENLHSVADLLAYMDRTGWELLHTTAVGGGRPGFATLLVEYQYIFRRKASQ